jgi:hypothetical protein
MAYWGRLLLCGGVGWGMYSGAMKKPPLLYIKKLTEQEVLLEAQKPSPRSPLSTIVKTDEPLECQPPLITLLKDPLLFSQDLVDHLQKIHYDRLSGYINQTNSEGVSALLYVITHQPYPLAYAKILIDYGADYMLRTKTGDNALTLATLGAKDKKLVQYFMDLGVSPYQEITKEKQYLTKLLTDRCLEMDAKVFNTLFDLCRDYEVLCEKIIPIPVISSDDSTSIVKKGLDQKFSPLYTTSPENSYDKDLEIMGQKLSPSK